MAAKSPRANQIKARMRAMLLDRIGSIPASAQRAHSQMACNHASAWPTLAQARCVMVFVPLPSELDITPLLEKMLAQNVRVCLPRTDWEHKTIVPIEISNLSSDLVPGRHGLSEPCSTRDPIPLDAIQVVVVPGLGFDRQGGRLCRGGGFYDRFLAALAGHAQRTGTHRPRTISLCFAEQIVPSVPMEEHDARVSCLATPDGLDAFTHDGS